MKRFHLILPAFVLLVASAAVQPDVIETPFKQLDTNGEGKLSADEVKAAPEALQQRLKGADKNNDGVLTLADVQRTLGLVPVLKDPLGACHSLVICPRPL